MVWTKYIPIAIKRKIPKILRVFLIVCFKLVNVLHSIVISKHLVFMQSLRSKLFFQLHIFYSESRPDNDFMTEDLSRPCDACGKPIGGGYRKCLKCNIYFCFCCGNQLMLSSKENSIVVRCPMCDEKMEWQNPLLVSKLQIEILMACDVTTQKKKKGGVVVCF